MAEQTSKADRVKLNRQLAQMLKGGVIMDVTTPEQARIAEEAGACAVMALSAFPPTSARRRRFPHERPQHDQGHPGGRFHPRHGEVPHRALRRGAGPSGHRHRLHRRVRGALAWPTTPTTSTRPSFDVPFVCGARDLGEALRRIAEGATMIRTKGEPGTGDVVQAVRHMRKMNQQIAASRLPARR